MTPQTCPEAYLLVTPHLVKLTAKHVTDLIGKWFRERGEALCLKVIMTVTIVSLTGHRINRTNLWAQLWGLCG